MRYESAQKFWQQCIRLVASGEGGQYVENVSVLFDEDTNEGAYDCWSNDDFDTRLKEVRELAALWDGEPRKTAGDLLLSALEKSAMPSDRLKLFSRVLAGGLATSKPDKPGGAADGSDDEDDPFAYVDEIFKAACEARPPKKIRDSIARRVIGQSDAVKTSAMIAYNHLNGQRTHAVFCGPSGCGKSEIWRCLSIEYPDRVRLIDFSRFAADGWKGSVHLRDIFEGIDPEKIRKRGLIVVLDEADKILCEHAIGPGGTDHHAIAQNSLLKMLDGDVIEFGAEDKQPALTVDCSKISVVMLGAFEKLLTDKSGNARRISPARTAAAGRIAADTERLTRRNMKEAVAGHI